MTSINFVLRPSVRAGRHPGSLAVRLINERRVKTFTLKGFRLYPEEWDRETQQIVYPESDSHRVKYLEALESKIHDGVEMLNHHLLALEKQGRYSVDDLLCRYRQCTDGGKVLGFTEILADKLEKGGQYRTARAYRTVTRGLVRFNKGKDIPLRQINACLIRDFEKHLKDTGRLPNTVSYYMRNLRAIYNKAVADKLIPKAKECPFISVYKGITKTMKRALALDEIQKLYNLDFENLLADKKTGSKEYRIAENLYRAQRYFEFCFYARGMSFVDMVYLRKENIRGGFIRYVRKKTGQQMEIKITAKMQEILDSFSTEVQGSPYVFPIIKESSGRPPYLQYETALRLQNSRLKRLSVMVGIKKQISTHWTRHSWATIAKKENVPIRVISECLGHTSEHTTLIYLDSLDNSVLDATGELIAHIVSSHVPEQIERTLIPKSLLQTNYRLSY